jgi:hypothetical protein
MRPAPGQGFVGAIIAGAIAAIVSGVIWGAITAITAHEVGYVALGVGALVGFAVIKMTPERSAKVGLIAAALALLGLFIGKMLGIEWGTTPEVAKSFEKNQAVMAGAVFEDMVAKGEVDKDLAEWMKNSTEDEEAPVELQPKLEAVSQKVVERLKTMSPEEKKAMRKAKQAVASIGYVERIKKTATPYDILWILLALGAAWKIGTGTALRKQEQAPTGK